MLRVVRSLRHERRPFVSVGNRSEYERLEAEAVQSEQEETVGTDEVQAHRLATNTNEEALADDE